MLKNILKLNGAQPLSKNEQGSINGGGPGSNCCNNTCIDQCYTSGICASGGQCMHLWCNGDSSQPYGICVGGGEK